MTGPLGHRLHHRAAGEGGRAGRRAGASAGRVDQRTGRGLRPVDARGDRRPGQPARRARPRPTRPSGGPPRSRPPTATAPRARSPRCTGSSPAAARTAAGASCPPRRPSGSARARAAAATWCSAPGSTHETEIGLGLWLSGPNGSYGPNPRAFGHDGFGGSCGLADPEAGVSLGYVMNRMGPHIADDPRKMALVDAAVQRAVARGGGPVRFRAVPTDRPSLVV